MVREKQSCFPLRPCLRVEPDFGQVLPDVVAGRDVPALHLLVVDDDAVPPDRRDDLGLIQQLALEVAQQRNALGTVELSRLLVVQLVKLAIGVSHECRAFVTIPCEAWHYEDCSEAKYDDVGKRKVGEPPSDIGPLPSFVILERDDGMIEGIGYYEEER